MHFAVHVILAAVAMGYLQKFPGGQGKHSLSSCRPPWFEGVYDPLGQGSGTMVPVKPDAFKVALNLLISII